MYSKNRKRLLLVNLGRQFGGVEKVCENIITNLDCELYRPYILCIKDSLFHRHIIKYTDRVLLLPSSKFLVFIYFPLTCMYIVKHKINIIHCHGIFSSLIGSICGFFLRRKIVTTIHGVVTIERENNLKGKLYRLMEDSLLNINHKYICVSKFLKTEIEDRLGKSDKLDVIYNSVKSTKEYYESNNNEDITISAVGRLETIKGQMYLIKAVERLVNEGFNIKCFIAGEGTQKKPYQDYIDEKKLSQNVKLVGFIDDINKFISSKTIFVNPSLMETFGLSVVEAMSIGMPIVATDVGALREIIKNDYSGMLVRPNDEYELYTKIKLLIQDNQKRTWLSINAKAESSKRFSTNSMITSYSQLYNNI